MPRLPLEGVRVLDITQIWAGPYATQLLADWGAEVIRVESTQIAPIFSRVFTLERVPPTPGVFWLAHPDWELGQRHWNRFALFNVHARNKLSATMDLTRPDGREVFDRLLRISDVFIENNTPSTIDKLGLSYDAVRKQKQDIIMVRMPGFGLGGPYQSYRAMGNHAEALVGHTWIKGYTDSDPSLLSRTTIGDGVSGLYAALATMMALRFRRRTGKGQLIEQAQVEAMASFLPQQIVDYTMNRRVERALGNRDHSMAPHDCFPCKGENEWVIITIGDDEEWESFVRALGNPSWATDPRFATVIGRYECQDELYALISQWTRAQDPYQVTELLQAHGVTAGPVIHDKDAFSDPQYQARGFFQELTHEDCGTHLYPGIMWKASGHPNRIRRPPCRLGEHNEYVYRELLGYTAEEYSRMETEGHIGTAYVHDLEEQATSSTS